MIGDAVWVVWYWLLLIVVSVVGLYFLGELCIWWETRQRRRALDAAKWERQRDFQARERAELWPDHVAGSDR
jgi:hypothetical protein